MTQITRRKVLAGLGGGLAGIGGSVGRANTARSDRPVPRGGAPARPRADPVEASRALIAERGLSGTLSCCVLDARTGRQVFAATPDTALPPASVMKAVTAAYAFDALGPGHRFETRVLARGPMRDGRLEGDLVLAGSGAPGLSTAHLAQLVEQLRETGLREVTGRLLVWDGALPRVSEIDPGQPDHLGYNASVSGLNLNYNRVHFQWRRRGQDYDLSMDARAGRHVPQVSHSGMLLAGRRAPLYVHEVDPETGREVWSVARGALGGGGTRWLPVRDSGLYAADVFATLLRAEGIDVPAAGRADSPPGGAVLASHVSEPLGGIARGMLRYSNNMTAEVLGLSASLARGAAPQGLAESAAAMTGWARDAFGIAGPRFVDHSGLGDASRITARQMCTMLRRLGPDGALARVMRDYVLRDDNGATLPVAVRAKTGTLNFVSALAGHVRTDRGTPLVFAIFTADLARRAAIPEGQEDRAPGSGWWAGKSREMQFDLVRIWGTAA